MININQGRNAALMNMCRPLTEYAWIVDSIRQENKTNTLDAAIDKTINRLPGDFVTKPFLEAHRAEVKNMLLRTRAEIIHTLCLPESAVAALSSVDVLTEYNEAETMELFKEEGRAEGTDSASLRSIRNLMRTMKLTAQEAMNALGIPEGDRNRYAEML